MNKMKNISSILFLMISFLLLSSCKKDKIVFQGNDNYITSFALNQSGNVLYASITDENITIKAPDDLSLVNAKVIFVLSENAKIYPDPSSITEWDDEMQFVITAHNGDKKTYKYAVTRSSNAADQSVVLPTQADVDAFGKLGITEIGGSLIIGNPTGKDSINNLAPLQKLRKIGYSFVVYPTYSSEAFVGLDQLKSVGDVIRIEGVKNLSKITFAELETAGSISIKSPAMVVVDMPSLKNVSKALLVDGPLAGVSFPLLQNVGGTLTFSSTNNSATAMPKLTLPSLKEAGGLTVLYLSKVTKVELPELVKIGDMNFVVLASLTSITSPKLATVTGLMTLPAISSLREVSFPSLVQAAGVIIDAKSINLIEFPKLEKISGNIRLNGPAVDGIKNFSALTEVGGELYLGELAQMKTFALPASLKKVGKLSIVYRTAAPPSQINIKGLSVNELNFRVVGAVKLIGDEDFKGTLNIYPEAANAVFPELEGFSTVDSLYIFPNYYTEVNLKGVKKIRSGLTIPTFGQSKLNLADLEEVGRALIFTSLQGITSGTLEVPKLKKVGGKLDISANSATLTVVKFVALESVGGDMNISTGATVRCLSDMLFPSLERIQGKLTIFPSTSSSPVNARVVNLDGFSTLKQVKSIEVRSLTSLTSFLGLKNAFPSITKSGWLISKNAYNPTYEDIVAGGWVK